MPAAIEVRDLVKAYGDTRAVDGLSFAVEEGEVVAILGPNGAGKSTTVEILEGHRARTSGEVTVLGVDPGQAGPGFRDRLGIVLQSAGVDKELTVREVLHFYRVAYSRPRDVDELIALVELEDKADERVSTLSGGQQRRVDLALGLIGDPDLIFLDEPTTGFDPAARRRSWDLIRNLTALGRTVVLTTHSLEEAEHLGDRIGIMSGGEVTALGTSLFLKSKVGGDYELRVIALERERMEQKLKSFVPEAVLIDNSAGALKYSVGKKHLRKLPSLFRWLETDGKEVVKEWGLQQTTLEEVFIRLARKADGKGIKDMAAIRRAHTGISDIASADGKESKTDSSSLSDVTIKVDGSIKTEKKRGSMHEHKLSSDHHMEMNSVSAVAWNGGRVQRGSLALITVITHSHAYPPLTHPSLTRSFTHSLTHSLTRSPIHL